MVEINECLFRKIFEQSPKAVARKGELNWQKHIENSAINRCLPQRAINFQKRAQTLIISRSFYSLCLAIHNFAIDVLYLGWLIIPGGKIS